VTPPTAVVDTNVVVSGLLTGDAGAPTRTILDSMLDGGFRFLLSIELIAEYRDVLLRPGISKHPGLTDDEVDRILEAVVANGMIREPETGSIDCPDPGDVHVRALLSEEAGAVFVTGDRALLEAPAPVGSVMSPASFAEMLPSKI
jgi:putative PIN family toxin of toxin-antitoxin system